MRDIPAYTSANRLGWDEIAADRGARPARFFMAGGCTLDDIEVQLMPGLQGSALLHLACANGNDSLSLAALGARVTGIDISDVAVRLAQAIADEAGLDARFTAADVYDLPADLGVFDIVYMSGGGICWMPDLQLWAEIAAAHVKPGGRLALFEHHPVWEILAVRDGAIALAGDYFGRAPRPLRHADAAKRPVGWRPDVELTTFVWPVSEVVTALIQAGLRIDTFTESAVPEMYRGLDGDPTWLPASYAIIASKAG